MKFTKTLSAFAAVAAGLGLAAQASAISPQNVGGVVVDTDGFSVAGAQLFETTVSAPGDVLLGFGSVDAIRASDNSLLWETGDNGVELTFEFSYVVESISASEVVFSGGTLTAYVDSSTAAVTSDVTTFTDGDVWANLEGEAGLLAASPTATLFAQVSGGSFLTGTFIGSGFGFLSVDEGAAVVGLADGVLNTDQFSGADALFGSNFDTLTATNSNFPVRGTGNITFAPTVIPEPMTAGLGLIALGGVGLAAMRRSR